MITKVIEGSFHRFLLVSSDFLSRYSRCWLPNATTITTLQIILHLVDEFQHNDE